jgi:hypothetical protein
MSCMDNIGRPFNVSKNVFLIFFSSVADLDPKRKDPKLLVGSKINVTVPVLILTRIVVNLDRGGTK